MASAAREIRRLQIERPELNEIVRAQPGKFIEQLRKGLAFRFAELGEAIEGIERPRLSVFENSLHPWHPVGPLAVIEVADYVEHRPGIFAFVALCPGIGQSAQQCVKGGRACGREA